ncbi:hypothetical protein L9F63_023961, partial [Diploptera punctata]
ISSRIGGRRIFPWRMELNLNTNVLADFQSVHGTLKLNSRINTLRSCFEMFVSFLSSTLMS